MSKQRIFMLIATAIGALACFLPWMNAPIVGSVVGTQGPDGYICLGLFVGAGSFVLLGDRTKLLWRSLGISSSLCAAGAMAIGIWKIVNAQIAISQIDKSSPLAAAIASSVNVGIGLYLLVAAGAAVPVLFGLTHRPTTHARTSSIRGARGSRQNEGQRHRRDNDLPRRPKGTVESTKASSRNSDSLAKKRRKLEVVMGLGLLAIVGSSWLITRDPASASAVAAELNSPSTPNTPGHQPSPAVPRALAGGEEALTFGRPTVKGGPGGMMTVMVEATNRRGKALTCTVTATFKRGDTILTVANGVVNALPPGGTKTAQLMTTDNIDGYDIIKLESGACF